MHAHRHPGNVLAMRRHQALSPVERGMNHTGGGGSGGGAGGGGGGNGWAAVADQFEGDDLQVCL